MGSSSANEHLLASQKDSAAWSMEWHCWNAGTRTDFLAFMLPGLGMPRAAQELSVTMNFLAGALGKWEKPQGSLGRHMLGPDSTNTRPECDYTARAPFLKQQSGGRIMFRLTWRQGILPKPHSLVTKEAGDVNSALVNLFFILRTSCPDVPLVSCQ
jgi:hypothetical protein